MPEFVTVCTGSRLHFGPLAVGAKAGRQFGGIGVMIDSPGVKLTVSRADQDTVIATAEIESRVRQTVATWRKNHNVADAVCIRIEDFIPGHQGLGSGTQLALAVAQGLHILQTGRPCVAVSLAMTIGRGRRSAIGIHGFDYGGFLIDAGKAKGEEIGALAARGDVPVEWRFVLITPRQSAGLSGDRETAVFAEMKPMPAELTARLCRLALMDLLPSVRNAEFGEFADALEDFGTLVGEFFAPVQGGDFAHPAMNGLANHLRKNGIAGIAQSSWGPTVAVPQPDEQSAIALAAALTAESRWGELHCRIVSPRNRGAEISC